MSFSYEHCSQIPGPLEPYGDIAGLGVVLTFVISAWLTILVLVAYYVFVFDPVVNPFHSTRSTTSYDPNPLDLLIARYTKSLRFLKGFTGSLAEDAFHKCILALADTQLVTGISILVSGYMSLKHGKGLSAYHWKMVVSLAWFSSVTHLSALTFLRSYLAKHPAGRTWRLALMLLLLVLLFVGFLPTGHFDFLTGRIKEGLLSQYNNLELYGGYDDQIAFANYIDLGRLTYPRDCENRLHSDYYADGFDRIFKNLTNLQAELLRNGTIGPRNCTRSGVPVFEPEIPSDTIDFYRTKYLRLLKRQAFSQKYLVEIAILYETAAVCFFKGGMRGSSDAYVSMVSSLVLLVYGYIIRAAKTFEGSSHLISHRIQTGLDQCYGKWIAKWANFLDRRKRSRIAIPVLVILPLQASIHCTFRIFLHLYTSMFAEVFSVLLSALWGTLSIASLKNVGDPEEVVEENEWTFGQIISLALLSSSLLPIWELIYKSCTIGINRKDTKTQASLVHSSITSQSEAVPDDASHSAEMGAAGGTGFELLRPDASSRTAPGLSSETNFEQAAQQNPGLIDAVHVQTDLEKEIALRLANSSSSYEKVWTFPLVLVMTGPFIFVILQITPTTRPLVRFSPMFGQYASTNHLVSAAKTVATLPFLVQPYIHFRQRIHNLAPSKNRTALDVAFFIATTGSAVFLAIASSIAPGDGMLFVLCIFGPYHIAQLAVLLWDFRRLCIKSRHHREIRGG